MSALESFIRAWEHESKLTTSLLRSLPADQYEFQPDPQGRSLGQLAWHLAEIEGYMTFGIEAGSLLPGGKRPPGLERPRTIEALATGYERVHAEAVARVRGLVDEDLEREIPFFNGKPIRIRNVLWSVILHHEIHHRGQLQMLVRLAGGIPAGLYGPSREDTAAMKARA